jgi:hypothetical protein
MSSAIQIFHRTKTLSIRSQWQRGLKRQSRAEHLPRLWVRIPPGLWILVFFFSVVCFQVEVCVTSWSLIQRSPKDCGASLCVWYRNLVNGVALYHWGKGDFEPKIDKRNSLTQYALLTFLLVTEQLSVIYFSIHFSPIYSFEIILMQLFTNYSDLTIVSLCFHTIIITKRWPKFLPKAPSQQTQVMKWGFSLWL